MTLRIDPDDPLILAVSVAAYEAEVKASDRAVMVALCRAELARQLRDEQATYARAGLADHALALGEAAALVAGDRRHD